MISSNKIIVQQIVQTCINNGVTKAVISPGSRNAPLSIAFDEASEIETFVIHDERSAGFFALGMSEQLNQVVVLICTSGSALLNYYPAIAEAHYRELPLFVLSADRPKEWINHGDGQTIVQNNVFTNHIKGELYLSDDDDSKSYISNSIIKLNKLFSKGLGLWKGPFHVNLALSEPLYETTTIEASPVDLINRKNISYEFSADDRLFLEKTLNNANIIVLCGQSYMNERLNRYLVDFSDNTNVIVIVENTSNQFHKKFIHCIDRTLCLIPEDQISNYIPDVLITIGGAIVSKKIKALFRNNKPNQHIRISNSFPEMDTYRSLSKHFNCTSERFFEFLSSLSINRNTSNFGSKWKQIDYTAIDKTEQLRDAFPYSDLYVFDLINNNLPKDCYVHMGNSSVVRYFQLFDPSTDESYFSNRGTSGIEGSTSTAIGAAYAVPQKQHLLITGDVSFFYDSNAFWNHYIGSNIKIILINNGGGGIFNIIDGASSSKQREKYFEAAHSYTAEYLCKCFNIDYTKAFNKEDIEKQLPLFLSEDKSGLIEVFTPGESNAQVLKNYFKDLST